MTPVGGSRHYGGAGLGQMGLWGCPSCGEDNTGPLEQGCVHCGAGKPGARSAAPAAPPPPPAPPTTEVVPPYAGEKGGINDVGQGDVADYWASQHPEVSVAEAYRAGYAAGIAALRAAQSTPRQPETFTADRDARIGRTMIAALTLFRDQVLIGDPEEITSGEWSSVAEVDRLLTDIRSTIEVPHA